MPSSLTQALEAEIKRQGVPATQIQELELDQKCRAGVIQVSWCPWLRFLLSGCYPKNIALYPHLSRRREVSVDMLAPSIFLRRA